MAGFDWRVGGWTGSLNRCVRREVRKHLRENPAARRTRFSNLHRALRRFLSIGTFARFIAAYVIIHVFVMAVELVSRWLGAGWLPAWVISGSQTARETDAFILSVSGYLITTQVGALAVIAIALALVTIISQRESSSSDVQLYYYGSLAFEVVASSLSLLAVLVIQLVWPAHLLMYSFGYDMRISKIAIFGVHIGWLLINLAALAHFIRTTFQFVQQSAREELRERYTAHVVQPSEMEKKVRQYLYRLAGFEMLRENDGRENGEDKGPRVWFGADFGARGTVEIETHFKAPYTLHNVHVIWVRWVVQRWAARCETNRAGKPRPSMPFGYGEPELMFGPNLDSPLRGNVAWCRRSEGVPLTRFERFVLRRAFRFRRKRDET